MTDDRGHDDASDWLSSQFGSHDEATSDDATGADEVTDAAGPGKAAGPEVPPASGDSAEPAEDIPSWPPTSPEKPVAPEPAVPATGGFNWGLTPTNAAAPTPPVSPTPSTTPEASDSPAAPPEPVQAPEVVVPPTPVSPAPPSFAPPPLVVPSVLPTADSFFPPVAPSTTGSEPQPFDAALAGSPSTEAEPPTMALPWEGPATELFAPPVASASVAEPATELLGGFGPDAADAAAGSSAEGSSVDALFGGSQFHDYQTGSLATAGPTGKPAPAKAPREPRAPLPRSQKVLFWIAGSLAALLVLLGLFFLGTKLPRSSAAPAAATTPTASAKSSPSPSPTPTVLPVGPLAAGSYEWDRLLGGECLAPFTSPWAEKFTVVDCGTPHPAQMVARGVFAETPPAASNESSSATPSVGEPASSYPGADALQAQINLLCTAPSVIDFAAAGAYSDIQILGSYPATAKQWADGERSYFCFVTRSSGEPITGSLATPKAP